MRKRFLWSMIFAIIPMAILVPVNHYLTANIDSFKEATDRNFTSLTIIEYMLVYMLSFVIVNQYFILHPDYNKVVFSHRSKNPDIPTKYYENNMIDDIVDNINKMIDKDKDKDEGKEKKD